MRLWPLAMENIEMSFPDDLCSHLLDCAVCLLGPIFIAPKAMIISGNLLKSASFPVCFSVLLKEIQFLMVIVENLTLSFPNLFIFFYKLLSKM